MDVKIIFPCKGPPTHGLLINNPVISYKHVLEIPAVAHSFTVSKTAGVLYPTLDNLEFGIASYLAIATCTHV